MAIRKENRTWLVEGWHKGCPRCKLTQKNGETYCGVCGKWLGVIRRHVWTFPLIGLVLWILAATPWLSCLIFLGEESDTLRIIMACGLIPFALALYSLAPVGNHFLRMDKWRERARDLNEKQVKKDQGVTVKLDSGSIKGALASAGKSVKRFNNLLLYGVAYEYDGEILDPQKLVIHKSGGKTKALQEAIDDFSEAHKVEGHDAAHWHSLALQWEVKAEALERDRDGYKDRAHVAENREATSTERAKKLQVELGNLESMYQTHKEWLKNAESKVEHLEGLLDEMRDKGIPLLMAHNENIPPLGFLTCPDKERLKEVLKVGFRLQPVEGFKGIKYLNLDPIPAEPKQAHDFLPGTTCIHKDQGRCYVLSWEDLDNRRLEIGLGKLPKDERVGVPVAWANSDDFDLVWASDLRPPRGKEIL